MFVSLRTVALLFTILIVLVLLTTTTEAQGSFSKDMGFEVLYHTSQPSNETHIDFGIKVEVTNNGRYSDFVYKRNFYLVNTTGTWYLSETSGSFKLYPDESQTFSINFSIPAEMVVTTIHYESPDGDEEYEFPLKASEAEETDRRELDSLDIIMIVVIGVVFLVALGLIYIFTSFFKKKKRRDKFLRY